MDRLPEAAHRGTALTIILDGVDNQLLPNAQPRDARSGASSRRRFGERAGGGPVRHDDRRRLGGVLGDRLAAARRCSAARSSFAADHRRHRVRRRRRRRSMLLRFLAGVGLGGAMPNAAALASEYVPRRQPAVRGHADDRLHPARRLRRGVDGRRGSSRRYGWRALFMVGGIIPIVLAAVLFVVLPESPRFLARRGDVARAAPRCCAKMGHDVPARRRVRRYRRMAGRDIRARRHRSAICSRRRSAGTRSACSARSSSA